MLGQQINAFFMIIGIMRLENLRWYDWLFIFFVGLWLIPLIEMLTHSGVLAIFFYAIWLNYCLLVAIPYIPIYIAYKIYRYKKERKVRL